MLVAEFRNETKKFMNFEVMKYLDGTIDRLRLMQGPIELRGP